MKEYSYGDFEEERRGFYQIRLFQRFIDPSTNAIDREGMLKSLQKVRNAFRDNKTVKELDQDLADDLLIVPGDNTIGQEQATDFQLAYTTNRTTWDKILDQWQQRQNGKNNGK